MLNFTSKIIFGKHGISKSGEDND